MLAWRATLVFFIKLNLASAICNEFRHQRAIHQVALPRRATGSAASDNAVEPWLAMFDEGQQNFLGQSLRLITPPLHRDDEKVLPASDR